MQLYLNNAPVIASSRLVPRTTLNVALHRNVVMLQRAPGAQESNLMADSGWIATCTEYSRRGNNKSKATLSGYPFLGPLLSLGFLFPEGQPSLLISYSEYGIEKGKKLANGPVPLRRSCKMAGGSIIIS